MAKLLLSFTQALNRRCKDIQHIRSDHMQHGHSNHHAGQGRRAPGHRWGRLQDQHRLRHQRNAYLDENDMDKNILNVKIEMKNDIEMEIILKQSNKN